jgi:hypothetical protein
LLPKAAVFSDIAAFPKVAVLSDWRFAPALISTFFQLIMRIDLYIYGSFGSFGSFLIFPYLSFSRVILPC